MQISIHAPHEGERRHPTAGLSTSYKISIHAPHEGERQGFDDSNLTRYGISIHAPHEGERRAISCCISGRRESISIHAPHEGERPEPTPEERIAVLISIHAPHEGERQNRHSVCSGNGGFQSTLPTRGSDPLYAAAKCCKCYFNPRSPRGGATAEKCICMQHFREFTEYYPLRHGDARCIAPQDCIIQAFFGAKKRCFYVRLCFALKNKGVRG